MGVFNLRKSMRFAGSPDGELAFQDKRRRMHPDYDPYKQQKHPDDIGQKRNNIEQTGLLPDQDHFDGLEGAEEGIIDVLNHDRSSAGIPDPIFNMDGPRSNGSTYNGNIGDMPSNAIGSEATVVRNYYSPNTDNKPGRLPNGAVFKPDKAKALGRSSRLSQVDPMNWVRTQLRKDVYFED